MLKTDAPRHPGVRSIADRSSDQPRNRGASMAGRFVPTLIGIALVAGVILISHPDKIWAFIQRVDPLAVLAAALVNVPIVVLRAVRAQVVLMHLGHRVSFRSIIPVQLVGQTSSSVTPASSGDYARAYLWRRRNGVLLRTGAAVVMFERVYSLSLMMALAVLLVALPRFGFGGWVGVAIGLSAASAAPLIFEQIPPALERRLLTKLTGGRFLSRFTGGALGMVEHLRELMSSPLLLIKASTITLTIFVLSGIQVWLLLSGLGHAVGIAPAVAVYATSQVGGTLSTLPFGLGAMDALMVTVLAGYGVTVSTSATVAILLRAVATLPQAIAGLVAYLTMDKSSLSPVPAAVADAD